MPTLISLKKTKAQSRKSPSRDHERVIIRQAECYSFLDKALSVGRQVFPATSVERHT